MLLSSLMLSINSVFAKETPGANGFAYVTKVSNSHVFVQADRVNSSRDLVYVKIKCSSGYLQCRATLGSSGTTRLARCDTWLDSAGTLLTNIYFNDTPQDVCTNASRGTILGVWMTYFKINS